MSHRRQLKRVCLPVASDRVASRSLASVNREFRDRVCFTSCGTLAVDPSISVARKPLVKRRQGLEWAFISLHSLRHQRPVQGMTHTRHAGTCEATCGGLTPIARSIDLSAPGVGCLPLFHRASQSGRLTSSPRFLSFAWQAFVGRAGLTSAVRTARGHGIIECPGVEAYSCIDFLPSRKRMGLAGSSISAAPEPNPDTLPPADA